MDLAKLKEPFEAEDIEWRVQQAGKSGERVWARLLAYVTNRAIMNRLDDVCGPENWQNVFTAAPNDPQRESLLCGISIRIGEQWVTKYDGAANTEVSVGGELDKDTNLKGGFSNAMKRAAVQWGIGRYLYDLGETWAESCTTLKPAKTDMVNWRSGKTKEGQFFWWKPPQLSAVFLPKPACNSVTSPATGDAPHWTDWTKPPQEALESEEPHIWYMCAAKELLRHCGAQNTGNARAILNWINPDEPLKLQDVKTHPGPAKQAWEQLMDRSNTVPFTRMLHEALKLAEQP